MGTLQASCWDRGSEVFVHQVLGSTGWSLKGTGALLLCTSDLQGQPSCFAVV